MQAPSTALTRRVFLMFLSSHSGMLVTLLLLLGCSPLSLADNEDTHQGLWDKCDYRYYINWRCGDICANFDELCECGNTTLPWEFTPPSPLLH